MDMFGISAGADALGQGTTGAASAFYGNKLASSAAGDAQNFAQFMSNTAYRRAVRDMRLAGLNPMLAFQQGGATSPTTPPAQVFQPEFDMNIGKAVSSALAIKTQKDNARIVNAEARKAESDARGADFHANAAYYAEPQELQRLLNLVQERDRVNADTSRLRQERFRVEADTHAIAGRDFGYRATVPYSPEQLEVIRRSPFGEGKFVRKDVRDAVNRFITNAKEVGRILGDSTQGE